MKLYQSIFQKAWQITKQNRVLWVFGFFLLFWSGKGMELEGFFTNVRLFRASFSPFNPAFWNMEGWSAFVEAMPVQRGTLALLFIAFFALAAFVFILLMVSRIGLVDAFGKQSRSRAKKKKPYTFNDALVKSKGYFVPVASVNLLGKGATYALIGFAALPLFFADSQTARLLYTLILYLLVAPVTVLLSVWIQYAVNDLLLNGTKLDEAMKNGWILFRYNIGVSIEMVLMLFVGYFLVMVGSFVVAGLLSSPLLLASGLMTEFLGSEGMALLFYLVYAIFTAIILFIGVTLFSSWRQGVWTLLYIELTKGKKRSKTARLFKK